MSATSNLRTRLEVGSDVRREVRGEGIDPGKPYFAIPRLWSDDELALLGVGAVEERQRSGGLACQIVDGDHEGIVGDRAVAVGRPSHRGLPVSSLGR